MPTFAKTVFVPLSLSARRAWIEIIKKGRARRPGQVALRKESVDRNSIVLASFRAYTVALRKESVDRNFTSVVSSAGTMGRSPQGERG